MENLIDRVGNLSDRIKSLAGAQSTEKEAVAFKTRADELSLAVATVSAPARWFEAFKEKGIPVEVIKPRPQALSLAVQNMTGSYELDPTSILEEKSSGKKDVFKVDITVLSQQAMANIREAWSSYVLAQKPIVDPGRRNIWKVFPAYADQAVAVEELLGNFDSLALRLPGALEDLNRPEEWATELSEILGDLPKEIPEQVQELFELISKGTANVSHLNESEVSWLGDNKLLEKLSISWGLD